MRRALFLVTLLLAMSIPIVEADSEEGVVFSWHGNATSVELIGEWDWDNNATMTESGGVWSSFLFPVNARLTFMFSLHEKGCTICRTQQ